MRHISFETVVETAARLCGEAACLLPGDVRESLVRASRLEQGELGRDFFRQYLENADAAERESLPICQDTGFAVYFVRMGEELRIDGGGLFDALAAGTARGYREHYLRKSIVADPLFDRKNTGDNTPPVLHLELVPGDRLEIILAPKGGGAENMSALKMLKPSDGRKGVVDFVVDTVRNAGGNPCPPTIVGVGIGGTMEKAALLAKKALLRPVGEAHPDPRYAELETEILTAINATGVGPQGLGGDVTSLAVHIDWHPCHIASLPVAVNLNCHAARHREAVL